MIRAFLKTGWIRSTFSTPPVNGYLDKSTFSGLGIGEFNFFVPFYERVFLKTAWIRSKTLFFRLGFVAFRLGFPENRLDSVKNAVFTAGFC
jgi:hypothetical protein